MPMVFSYFFIDEQSCELVSGIGKGVYYSYPVTCENGKYTKILDLTHDAFSKERMDATAKELFQERDLVKHLLPN